MKNELQASNQLYSHTLTDEYTSAIFGIQILFLFYYFIYIYYLFYLYFICKWLMGFSTQTTAPYAACSTCSRALWSRNSAFLNGFSWAAGALSVGREVKCYLLHLSQALGSTWGWALGLSFSSFPFSHLPVVPPVVPSSVLLLLFSKVEFEKCCGSSAKQGTQRQARFIKKMAVMGVSSWLGLDGEVTAGLLPLIPAPVLLVLL